MFLEVDAGENVLTCIKVNLYSPLLHFNFQFSLGPSVVHFSSDLHLFLFRCCFCIFCTRWFDDEGTVSDNPCHFFPYSVYISNVVCPMNENKIFPSLSLPVISVFRDKILWFSSFFLGVILLKISLSCNVLPLCALHSIL